MQPTAGTKEKIRHAESPHDVKKRLNRAKKLGLSNPRVEHAAELRLIELGQKIHQPTKIRPTPPVFVTNAECTYPNPLHIAE